MRSIGDARYGSSGAGLCGIRFTLARTPLSSLTRRRASSSESLTPSSITYSNVNRSRSPSGYSRQAFIRSASVYLRLIGLNPDRFHHLVVIQKGLAHSHKHEVHAVRRFGSLAVDLVQDDDDLRDDLARRHAAFDAQLRSHAETASDGATHLATEADGVAAFFGHKHGLGFTTVAEP